MQLLILLIATTVGHAHKPSFGIHPTLNSAYHVDDTDISMVLYQDITCDADQVWLHFDAVEGEDIFFQVGVPVLERLTDYQPAIALIAEGLPTLDDPPIDVPDGYGSLIFNANETPAPFYEPFTQTDSWIWVEEFITMTTTGNAWLVAYHPEQETGKMWVAMGTVEDFSDVGPSDWASWVTALDDFHETDGERDIEEKSCIQPSDESPSTSAGCSATAARASWVSLALLPPLAMRRRQQRLQPTRHS